MKSVFFLTCLLSISIAQGAAKMSTPEATLILKSKDGFPVQGAALSGMLQYNVQTNIECDTLLPFFLQKN